MLRIDSKNSNYNAACVANLIQIAYFNATVNTPDNTVYVNINIDNKSAFIDNIAVAKADLEQFIDTVLEIDE